MADPERVTVGGQDFKILTEQPPHLRIGDRVFTTNSNLTDGRGRQVSLVGIVRDFHHHSYGNYASIEVESPPEYAGRIANIYSGKVLERPA